LYFWTLGEVTREEEAKSSHEEMIKKAKAVAAGSDVMSVCMGVLFIS
jgi:hypothetical protein